MARQSELEVADPASPSLWAMCSAALVAFTIECDNEIEGRFAGRRHGGMISLVAWLNAMQYLRDGPASVAEVCERTHTSVAQVKFLIGKLEHWGWVTPALAGGATGATRAPGERTARQSISAIKPSSTFEATTMGEIAIALWPEVIDTVESRWEQRCASVLTAALDALYETARSAGVLMPEGLPPASANRLRAREWREFPSGQLEGPTSARSPVLLGRALLAMTMAYEKRSAVPLALAANTLRVIGEQGTPVSKLHERSGTPPETAASQCKALEALGLANVARDTTARAKILRLTAKGREAQAAYSSISRKVEAAIDPDGNLSSALLSLLSCSHDGELALRAALTPPAGVRRSGTTWYTGAEPQTFKTRDREVVLQTEAFLADPFGALPHYPVWEATRAFGP